MSEQFIALDDQDESLIDKKEDNFISSLLFLFKFTKGQRISLFIAILFLMIFSALVMYSGYSMGILVGEGLVKKNWDIAKKYSMIVIAAELVALALNYFGKKYLVNVAGKTILKIRRELFLKLPKFPMRFFDRMPRGRIVTRLTHDVEGVESFFSGSLARVLHSSFLAIASMVAMLLSDLKLGAILILSMLPSFLIIFVTRNYVGKLNRAMSKQSSQINSRLSEFLDGLYVIRAFGLEEWSHDIFHKTVKRHVDATLRSNFFYSMINPLISFLCGLPIIMLILLGGRAVLEETMSIALFFAFLRYSERFFNPVMMLFREVHVILQSFTSTQRVANFLREKTEDVYFKTISPVGDDLIHGDIEFQNVWMSYSGTDWVLKDVSFKISRGQKIGLVGATGSGKTSCISVLSRLYEYQKGDILLDHKNLRHWDVEALRDQLGLVSQDITLFKGTLRENLSVDPQISDDKILEIAHFTGLDKVMNRANLKLDSEISENGANLSVGQKQIISLTRTCLLSPRILILDEATANVDEFYEKVLHEGIEKVMIDKTTFIIAHRLETISNCDQLLVFDQGRLVEIGPPRELMTNTNGYFYKLSQKS